MEKNFQEMKEYVSKELENTKDQLQAEFSKKIEDI